MRAVLLSIRPEWVEIIAEGKKTIEVRKTRPKLKTPFKCYIYETKGYQRVGNDNLNCIVGGNGRGMVIGEFVCDRVFDIEYEEDEGYSESYTPLGFSDCLNDEQFDGYLRAKEGYGWHISELKIYGTPLKLSDFRSYNTLIDFEQGYPMPTHGIKRPPQSWMYVQEMLA